MAGQRHAFILGGTGQIGRAVARDLLAAGWSVTFSHRGHRPAPRDLIEQGARVVTLERDRDELARTLGSGADALIDTTAYNRDHASQLIAVQASIGCFVVVSSASVYRDQLGRTLDEAAETGFPDLPDPIPETHPTVDPGPTTYSTRKVALERHLLDAASPPVTILRPCAIHGPNSRHPREWWLVKRMLDRRSAIPLAHRGTSRFHASAVANIAAVARIAAETPGSRVLNIADPDAPTVAEIAAHIARHLDYQGRIVAVDAPDDSPLIGRTPWSVPRPFVLDCRTAGSLGYVPATSYADAAGAMCGWLVEDAANGDWRQRYPVLAAYPWDHFDYETEDAFFRNHGASGVRHP
ncbi:NAD-dependent epimerase/dehydratase family protein [Rhodopila sp.]|uniref:NAD-dependent epimerase/dehydratase family protein n=1 Tax=Rhodopila sp. TaxID=2480087 RepID=UPI003D144361